MAAIPRKPEIHAGKAPVQGTAVAVAGAALLIRGPSGSGKSGLALQMMALGAELVADDRTVVAAIDDGPPVVSAPPEIEGMIEARGLGLLRVPAAGPTRLRAVLDLSEVESERLPPERETWIAGRRLPLLRAVGGPAFAAALVHLLRGGRVPT